MIRLIDLLIELCAWAIRDPPRRRRDRRRSWRIRSPGTDPALLEAWSSFAEGMGLEYEFNGEPAVSGMVRDVYVRIVPGRLVRPATVVSLELPIFVNRPLRVHPREGGDSRAPDRSPPVADLALAYAVEARDMDLARTALSDGVRAWLLALGDVELLVSGRRITCRTPRLETDLDRLRGLTELAVTTFESLLPND